MNIARTFWAPVTGVLLVVVGLVLAWTAPATASFGWFAYAPLTSTGVNLDLTQPQSVVGLVLALIGLLLVTGWVGFQIGRRR